MVHTNKKSLMVSIANVTKQSGINDCGLFAIAYCTSIAHEQNPSSVVYNQAAMRLHLYKCFEQGKIESFPIIRTKRPGNSNLIHIDVFCYCRCPDNGSQMVCCDSCKEWYHVDCIKTAIIK